MLKRLTGELELRRSLLRMRRLDTRKISVDPSEVCMYVCARNEELRLPYFLEHHFALGVSRVFLVANECSDRTIELALSFPNVHVFATQEPYARHMNWLYGLLDKYCTGCWCLIADVDELLVYPHHEQVRLPELCAHLDAQGCNALQCMLLDMYADKPLEELRYRSGANPIELCPYFDVECERKQVFGRHRRSGERYEEEVFVGGTRRRVFKQDSWISKVPLIKYSRDFSSTPGVHFIYQPALGGIRGGLLHFKYLQDFPELVRAEVARAKRHYYGYIEYQQYERILNEAGRLNLYFGGAARYRGWESLIAAGLLASTPEFDALARHVGQNAPVHSAGQ